MAVQRYYGVIEEAEGKWWVSFPDAPGCTAVADTEGEAISAATQGLSEWAEHSDRNGLALPSSRSLKELYDDPDVMDLVGSGAYFVSFPAMHV